MDSSSRFRVEGFGPQYSIVLGFGIEVLCVMQDLVSSHHLGAYRDCDEAFGHA